jgi:hypothetical protein
MKSWRHEAGSEAGGRRSQERSVTRTEARASGVQWLLVVVYCGVEMVGGDFGHGARW